MVSVQESKDNIDYTLRILDNLSVFDALSNAPKVDINEAVNHPDLNLLNGLNERVEVRKKALLSAAEVVLENPTKVIRRMFNEDDLMKRSGIVFMAEVDGYPVEVMPDLATLPEIFFTLSQGATPLDGVAELDITHEHIQEFNAKRRLQRDMAQVEIIDAAAAPDSEGQLHNQSMLISIQWDDNHREQMGISDYEQRGDSGAAKIHRIQTSWWSRKLSNVNGEPRNELVGIHTEAGKMPMLYIEGKAGERTEEYGSTGNLLVSEALEYPQADEGNSMRLTKRTQKYIPEVGTSDGWVIDSTFNASCEPNSGWSVESANKFNMDTQKMEGRSSREYDGPAPIAQPIDAEYVASHELLQQAGITLNNSMAPDISAIQRMILKSIPQ